MRQPSSKKKKKITVVAEALDVSEAGAQLAADVEARAGRGACCRSNGHAPTCPLHPVDGRRADHGAGSDTAAAGVIALAGGVNALEGFDGYSQVSDEAILLADPDVILMMDRSGDHAASNAEIITHPRSSDGRGPPRQVRSCASQDFLLLGFGPRTPEVVEALSAAFRQARSLTGHGGPRCQFAHTLCLPWPGDRQVAGTASDARADGVAGRNVAPVTRCRCLGGEPLGSARTTCPR